MQEAAEQRSTRYSLIPLASVDAANERLIWLEDTALAEALAGALGAVVSEAGGVVVPPLLATNNTSRK